MLITPEAPGQITTWDTTVSICAETDATCEVISDLTARSIAVAYMAPSPHSWNMTSLAHNRPFDAEGLLREIAVEQKGQNGEDDVLALDMLTVWVDSKRKS